VGPGSPAPAQALTASTAGAASGAEASTVAESSGGTEASAPHGVSAPDEDRAAVARLLGREPQGRFEVVVRDAGGQPVVIRNGTALDDGTPMPTRYWLVGRREVVAVSRLETVGGVRRAESEVDAGELAAAHARYRAERDEAIPLGWTGPRPAGGVGGTLRGVKCLHAHYAWHLAGGDDPVGRWVAEHLDTPGTPGTPGTPDTPHAGGTPDTPHAGGDGR